MDIASGMPAQEMNVPHSLHSVATIRYQSPLTKRGHTKIPPDERRDIEDSLEI